LSEKETLLVNSLEYDENEHGEKQSDDESTKHTKTNRREKNEQHNLMQIGKK
jgi:hypothetical protein